MDLLDERRKFIENAQKERQEREFNRQSNELFTKINAVARGFLSRRNFYNKLK
jgi:hypothetical protein